MSDLLNRYFERELALVRRSGDKFKGKHPQAANAMNLNDKRYEDPNITRLIEAVALLSAKNEMKLDQQLPHLSGSLANVLYPSFNQLLPSAMSMYFNADSEEFVKPISLSRGDSVSVLNEQQQQCQFTLCNDTELLPISLKHVNARFAPFEFDLPMQHQASAVIQLSIKANDPASDLHQVVTEQLPLYFNGFGQGAAGLIELLLSKLLFITVSDKHFEQVEVLPAETLTAKCIDDGFSVLPKNQREFSAYQMMLEYFNFSEKRKYFSIKGFKQAAQSIAHNEVVLSLFIKDLPSEFIGLFDKSVFQLNTCLVLNQFPLRAEPIYYTHHQLSAPVLPDATEANAITEIISINSVSEIKPEGEFEVLPLFAKRYFDDNHSLMWFSESQVNSNKQMQFHLGVSFDPQLDGVIDISQEHLLSAQLSCCNGRTPCTVTKGAHIKPAGAVELPGVLEVHSTPSVPHYPHETQAIHWRMIELLSTNFSSLIDVPDCAEKLRNLLSVFSRSSAQQSMIAAIQGVTYTKKVSSLMLDGVNIFATGTVIDIEMSVFDKKSSMNAWLFAHLLNQFYIQFCSFDRFIQVQVTLITANGKHQLSFDKHYGAKTCL